MVFRPEPHDVVTGGVVPIAVGQERLFHATAERVRVAKDGVDHVVDGFTRRLAVDGVAHPHLVEEVFHHLRVSTSRGAGFRQQAQT